MGLVATEDFRVREQGVPSDLFELLGRARDAIELDPDFTRSCLDEISRLLATAGAFKAGNRKEEVRKSSIPVVRTKGGLAPWQLKRVRAFVERQLGATIRVSQLAEIAELSPGHFCRAFKVSTGETPHGFVVRQRLRRAQRLMIETNDPLSHIAHDCGLTDQAHLTRLFRRFLDDTPMVWRRAWRSA